MPTPKHERTKAPHRASGEAMTARPVNGPVDFAAMRREVMAKFPKTLARLAN